MCLVGTRKLKKDPPLNDEEDFSGRRKEKQEDFIEEETNEGLRFKISPHHKYIL